MEGEDFPRTDKTTWLASNFKHFITMLQPNIYKNTYMILSEKHNKTHIQLVCPEHFRLPLVSFTFNSSHMNVVFSTLPFYPAKCFKRTHEGRMETPMDSCR